MRTGEELVGVYRFGGLSDGRLGALTTEASSLFATGTGAAGDGRATSGCW